MTIRDLIDQLQEFADSHGDDTEVRLAHQPSWPFEYSISEVVLVDSSDLEDDDEDDGTSDPDQPAVVYIGEGSQLGYLDSPATRALGWGRNR